MNEEVKKFFSDKAKAYWAGVDIVERSNRMKWVRQQGNQDRWYKMTQEQKSELGKKIKSYDKKPKIDGGK